VAAAKKEKEQQKNALKKARKVMRNTIKDNDYFASDDTEKINHMQEVERLAELLSLASMQELNEGLQNADPAKAKEVFLTTVKGVNDKQEEETRRHLEAATKKPTSGGAGEATSSSKKAWPDEELQLLIKAVNLFPAGTNQRWETISNFLQQHYEGSNRSAKEVLTKAKELQKMDMSVIKEKTNEKAFDRFAQTHHASGAAEKSNVSERLDSVQDQQIAETGTNPAPWTADEQKLLEQSLKTFPASTPERWERIAENVPSRSKKDCMKRYKEIVETIRAKKRAAEASKKK